MCSVLVGVAWGGPAPARLAGSSAGRGSLAARGSLRYSLPRQLLAAEVSLAMFADAGCTDIVKVIVRLGSERMVGAKGRF